MLFAARHRFHPRSQQDIERHRQLAALRAQIGELTNRIEGLENEQQTQLKRIAQMQALLDEILRILKTQR